MRALIKSVGITTIFVTHDQEEAMVVGDRIVVMNKGVIEQVGAAQDIYRRPDTAFVANFVGQNNLVPVTATASLMPGCASVQLAGTVLEVLCASHVSLPQAMLLALRPEHIAIVDDGSILAEAPCIRGTVTAAAFLGAAARYEVETALGLSLKVSTPASGSLVPPGQRVALLLDSTRAALVPVS